jgi:cytochrome bd-type quinol oxidase subunit 1
VADVAVSLGGFTLIYTVLGVIDVVLMARAARHGLDSGEGARPSGAPEGAMGDGAWPWAA